MKLIISKIKKAIVKSEAFIGAFVTTQIITASNNKILAAYSNADISSVTDGINILKDIALAVVGGIGVIFLSLGVVDFATSLSAHDTSQQIQGIKKAIAGVIMIAVPVILKLFT